MTDAKVVAMPEPPANTGFCPIPTARAIYSLAEYARRHGKITLLVTPPGNSKTTTLRQVERDKPRQTFLATMSQASSTLVPALTGIAEAMDAVAFRTGAYEVNAAIIRRIDELMSTGSLLVLLIDEAQNLADQALEQVRSIHDETGIGVVLAGNATFVTRFNGKRGEAHFAQLTSRIGMRLDLDGPLPEDVAVLCNHRDVRGRRARTYLEKMAERHHGLRQVFELVDFARIEVGEGNPVEYDHLRAAAQKLWGAQP